MHYICTGGCHGLSDVQKNCGDKMCSKYDHPLTPCDCTDSKHEGLMEDKQTNTGSPTEELPES